MCKSDLEQLTNGFLSDFGACQTSEQTYCVVGQWSIYLNGNMRMRCVQIHASEFTNVILSNVQIIIKIGRSALPMGLMFGAEGKGKLTITSCPE